MSEWRQFLILFRAHRRMLVTRVRGAVKRSRLMTATLLCFLIGYSAAAYGLFYQGLGYVGKLPGAGHLLTNRVLFLIFFCFFLMLTFSAAVTSYVGLFRSRETAWQLTLPVTHRVVFLWKTVESAAFSSWGLLFIITPLLLAYAQHRDAGFWFYVKTFGAMLPFLMITAALAALLLLLLVRWVGRRQLIAGVIAAGVALTFSALTTYQDDKELIERVGLSSTLAFRQVLSHTDISANDAWPSSWLTRSIIAWSRDFNRSGGAMFPILLLSYAMMGGLLAMGLSMSLFFTCWNLHVPRSAPAAWRSRTRRDRREKGQPLRFPSLAPRLFSLTLPRPLAAVAAKDTRSFLRDPAQWVQFLIVFGLLSLYAVSLRNMDYDAERPRDANLIAYLNLAVCALALSTLTTRFVFPQFSLEGRRLWILAIAPMKLQHLIWQKFVLSGLFTGILTFGILVLSGKTLELPASDILFFSVAIVMLSTGLNGIAVGFGALFPNMEETNAARIVSGFGGTLCLITSFLYISTFLGSLALARYTVFRTDKSPEGWFPNDRYGHLGAASALSLTLVATLVPLLFAIKRLKKLEILGKL
jgi:ABC-2 type transport system permease protein